MDTELRYSYIQSKKAALPLGSEKRAKSAEAKENADQQVRSRTFAPVFKKSGVIFHTECGKFLFMCLHCNHSCQSGVDIVKHIINSHFDQPKQNIDKSDHALPELVSINEFKSETKTEPQITLDHPCTSEFRLGSPKSVKFEDGDPISSPETKSVNIVNQKSANQLGISERHKTEDAIHVEPDLESATTKEVPTKQFRISPKLKTDGRKTESSPVIKEVKIVKLKRIKPNRLLKAMKKKLTSNSELVKTKAILPDASNNNIQLPPVFYLKSPVDTPSSRPMDCVRRQSCYQCEMVPEIHEPSDPRRHICPFCKIWFLNHVDFELHIKDVHKKDPGYLVCPEYYCYVCEREFVSLHTLNLHIERHREPDIFLCSFCGATQKTKGRLVEHMKQHEESKKFECNQCVMKFRRVGALRRHFWLHKTEPSFVCTVCSKGFKMQRYLERHMAVHEQPKISCSRCEAKFHFKTVLRAHERRRHRVM